MDLIERRGRGVTQRLFRFSAYLCALCGFFFAPSLSATVIVQKNGDVISGRILEEQADKYIFQSPYGKLQIAKTNVVKLILDEKTIELKTVQVGDKTVQARLVNQDKNTSVYLTEDGRTIRKEEGAETPDNKEPEKAPELKKDTVLISIGGLYGMSTFQRESTDASGGPTQSLNQSLHGNVFGGQVEGHYLFSRYAGAGVYGSILYSANTVSIAVPAGQPGTRESTAVNTSLFAAPSLVFSALGNLGSKTAAHDLRLALQGGISFNGAAMDLTFQNSPGFPSGSSASGKNQSIALAAQLYYVYSLSDSFRLRLGLGYFRAFSTAIYDGTLQNAPSQGNFKADFEERLRRSGDQPQVFSAQVGAEYGF